MKLLPETCLCVWWFTDHNDGDKQTTFTQTLWDGFSCINVHIILDFLQSYDAEMFRVDFRPFKCQSYAAVFLPPPSEEVM